jgi:hypothetical protein
VAKRRRKKKADEEEAPGETKEARRDREEGVLQEWRARRRRPHPAQSAHSVGESVMRRLCPVESTELSV